MPRKNENEHIESFNEDSEHEDEVKLLPLGHHHENHHHDHSRSRHRRRREFPIQCKCNPFGKFACFLLAVYFIVSFTPDIKGLIPEGLFPASTVNLTPQTPPPPPPPSPLKQCPASSSPTPASPPSPINLWAPLKVPETANIYKWLIHPDRRLNLTVPPEDAGLSDNLVFMIEAYPPRKEDALRYLDRGKGEEEMAPPDRYARVTIHHGGREEPVIKDYLVGPVPYSLDDGEDVEMTMTELNSIYHRSEIPFNAYGFAGFREMQQFIAGEITPELSEAMEVLFGGSARGLPNDALTIGASGPFSFDGSFRRLWITWRMNKAGPFLLPVGFYMYIDISGTDQALWGIKKVVYNHQIFPSTDAFLEAYNNGKLAIIPRLDQVNSTWTQRWRTSSDDNVNSTSSSPSRPFDALPHRDLDHLPGPRSVSFAGLRFRVDKERGYVSWMGWGFYMGFERDMGLALWDIRFKGGRIVYQLSPQEAIAQYAGNDPVQATTAWLDRYFGMGASVRSLLTGYDCPLGSVYLPATTFSSIGSTVVENAICIFEMDTGKPLSRHFGFMDGEFGAVKGYVLVVRSISTVGNYDYCYHICLTLPQFDYTFQLDGSIEVRVSASGYLQGGYWENDKQAAYGGKIRDTTMGNLHDHVINFKVDFDIAGTNNSFLYTSTVEEEVTQPWFDDDWGSTVIQQRIKKEFITNEDDSKVKYPPNFQGVYAVVNKEETNSWGTPRGYAIHPGHSPIHNTIVGSKRLLNNANWARYNLAVSKRKETEPSSSSMWNLHLPCAPMVDFHKFFDGESIEQEDLVAWINVGMHHLPQSEDSPNTKTNVATSSFLLTPLNYFDSDVSLDSMNAIVLRMPEKLEDNYLFDDYGVDQGFTCIPDKPLPFEYRFPVIYGVGGNIRTMDSEDAREMSEMYHRMKIKI